MPLTCECEYLDDATWYYDPPTDETVLKAKRSRRCCSCEELISPGSVVVPFSRWRSPKTWIEENIHGDEVRLATKYMCETCGDLYWSLDELGFCVGPGECMRELTREYAATYGPKGVANA